MNTHVTMSYLLKAQEEIDSIAAKLRGIVLKNTPHPKDAVGKMVIFRAVPDDEFAFETTVHRKTIRFCLTHALIADGSGHYLTGQYTWHYVERGKDLVGAGAGIQLQGQCILYPNGDHSELYSGTQTADEMVIFGRVATVAVAAIQQSLPTIKKH